MLPAIQLRSTQRNQYKINTIELNTNENKLIILYRVARHEL